MINWEKAQIEEYKLASKIAKRALKLLPDGDFQTFQMDIIATHISGCLLNLQKLFNADDFDFLHDICGINRNLNRETG